MGQVALLFAGQGAQKPGMGREIYEASPAARAVMDEIEALRPGTLLQLRDAAALATTRDAQPCLFAADLMCAAAAVEAGLRPDAAAGFSLGEWAAAAFSGALPLPRALALVARRAEWMQSCADQRPGGMVAVLRLPADAVLALCAELPEAWPANYNSPEQTVVSCPLDVLPALVRRAQALGGRAIRLNVAGAFHSPLMAPAAGRLAAALA
ncbi:MAG: ACP S-malonyltransferase, partial [Clostridiales bacterium]|nr:ACP S-malonyltransferase [Clostridiales bacterium]